MGGVELGWSLPSEAVREHKVSAIAPSLSTTIIDQGLWSGAVAITSLRDMHRAGGASPGDQLYRRLPCETSVESVARLSTQRCHLVASQERVCVSREMATVPLARVLPICSRQYSTAAIEQLTALSYLKTSAMGRGQFECYKVLDGYLACLPNKPALQSSSE